ncbi:MAG TPA: hypothetical protein VMG10_31220 [Gemmataceae bacterium]|nr:hypothetical protein [Gemmataceae bacterium]
MFELLSRASRTRKLVASRFASLMLERLEDRLSPAMIGPPPPSGETISLNVTYLPNREATFSGQLTNQSGPVANQTVNLTGVVNGAATTNSQGDFSVTLAVPQLGTEYAASADGLSNTAQYTLVNGAPVISDFTAMSLGNGLWEFSGSVSGAPTQGEVVNFGGITPLMGQSDSVNPDGSFDFYAIVNSGQGGWASAQAVDWWGDTSTINSTYVAA